MQNWTSNILLTYFTLTGTKKNASVYTEIEFTLILTVLWIQACLFNHLKMNSHVMQVSIKADSCKPVWSKASSETGNIVVSAKSQKWLPCLGQLCVIPCTTRILIKTLAASLAGLLSAPFSFLLGVIFPGSLPLCCSPSLHCPQNCSCFSAQNMNLLLVTNLYSPHSLLWQTTDHS